MIKITECPRDAMQGIKDNIPTALKIEYQNLLLECGFNQLDFGSFVSPKAIPQMKDTKEVLSGLKLNQETDLIAIIANIRGAQDALQFNSIKYLGYPFSISETFQLRNTNSTINQSLESIKTINTLAAQNQKELLVYISMGFGNPYKEEWSPEIVIHWVEKLAAIGIKHFALSDTIGCSTPKNIKYLFENLIPKLPKLTIGAHLHSRADTIIEKVDAAIEAGCKNFDVAIKGYGGCPMAKDDLTGNMDTIVLLNHLNNKNIKHSVNMEKFNEAVEFSAKIFNHYH